MKKERQFDTKMRQIVLKTTIFLILLIQLAHSKSLQLTKEAINNNNNATTDLPEKALFKEMIKRSSPDEPMSNPYLKSTGFSLIKHDLIDKYADAQSHLSECMPGSIFYNGTVFTSPVRVRSFPGCMPSASVAACF